MNQSFYTVLFLYNPHSGDGTVSDQLEFIIRRFQEANHQIIPYRLSGMENLSIYLDALPFEFIDKVVISGGDGTLHQIINQLAQRAIKKPIGIFPTGTANDFSQYFNIPSDIEGMVDVVTQGLLKPCDLGKANDAYFINVACFGNLVDISQRVNPQAKNVLGVLAYYIKGIEEIPKLRAFEARIKTPKRQIDELIYFALFMNGQSAGGFRKIAPYSEINDGLLDVVVFKKCPVYELMPLLIKVVNGEHPNSEYIEYFKANELEVSCDSEVGTDLDGEAGPDLPMTISVLSGYLEIFSGEENAE